MKLADLMVILRGLEIYNSDPNNTPEEKKFCFLEVKHQITMEFLKNGLSQKDILIFLEMFEWFEKEEITLEKFFSELHNFFIDNDNNLRG